MKFGIITPWPAVKNAEYEVIKRVQIVTKKLGHKCLVVTADGCILDRKHNATKNFIESRNELDFIIAMHYETPKLVDSFMYQAMWNPPDFSISQGEYYRFSGHHLMYDDLLVYDSPGILNHARMMLEESNLEIDESFQFVAAVPDDVCEPNLDEVSLFYCGINWEKCTGNKGRHSDLFERLDKMPYMKIYGPKKFIDIEPWEGFKSYQFPIPFDGKSMIEEISSCGVSLVISSDIHRRAGAATNRLFESCAAGAVIISDENYFIKKYFGDAALFIDYDKKNPSYTFRQIDKHMRWIEENKEEALELAKKSQKIFLENFTLDKQIERLCERHKERSKIVANFFNAKDDSDTIDIFIYWRKDVDDGFENMLKRNILNQTYSNIRLVILCDTSVEKDLRAVLKELNIKKYDIITADVVHRGSRTLTSGNALVKAKPYLKSKYFTFLSDIDIWFSDHLTTLKRTFEDSDDNIIAAYSGEFVEHTDRTRIVRRFEKISPACLLNCNNSNAGSLLIAREVLDDIRDYWLDYIDGCEHYILLLSRTSAYSEKPYKFSKKLTSGYYDISVYAGSKDEELMEPLMDYDNQRRIIQDIFKFRDIVATHVTNDIVQSGAIDPVVFSASMKRYCSNIVSKNRFMEKIARFIYRKFIRK